jgi:hypothetical protein
MFEPFVVRLGLGLRLGPLFMLILRLGGFRNGPECPSTERKIRF